MNTTPYRTIHRRDHTLVRALLTERNRRLGSDYEIEYWPELLNSGQKEVEAIAKNGAGCRIAVEHTLIQPFVDKKSDDVRFMQVLGVLEADQNLRIPNFMIEVHAQVASIPKCDWQALSATIRDWFKREVVSLPEGTSKRAVPGTGIVLAITKTSMEAIGGDYPGRIFIGRIAPPDSFDDVLRTALANKLPKLLEAAAEKRVLLVEKEDCYDSQYKITEVLQRIGTRLSGFERLDEIWLVMTIVWISEGVVWFGPVWPKTMIAYHGNSCQVRVPFT